MCADDVIRHRPSPAPSYVPILVTGDGREFEGLAVSSPDEAMTRALAMYAEIPGPMVRVYVETRARWEVATSGPMPWNSPRRRSRAR